MGKLRVMQREKALKAKLKDYKTLIEVVAKVEYQKLNCSHLVDYSEIVNIGTHTLYLLFKKNNPEQFNDSYLSTAIKWAIRNEIRRRYKWYSLKNKKECCENDHEDIREALYKTILSIDEMADAENPKHIKDDSKNPEENLEFFELKNEIIKAIRNLPQRERELIESKFFNDKKLKEIARDFNISPSRISRIIQIGLNKVKKDLLENNIV